MQYSTAEVGVVNKVIGLWLTILGALHRRRADDPPRPVAGAAAVRHPADARQPRLLVAGGERPRRLPGLTIPPFDWGFVKLAEATPVDGGLLMAIASENITSGMGTPPSWRS
jgi:PAT family beta-lactamase induction signal transducer AmpG